VTALLPYVVVGVASGSVYGLAGMGLVLTYRTTGIFNFAHGAVATAAAYLFFELWIRNGWPWPLAAVASVVAVAGLGGLAMERIGRRLQTVPLALRVVATVGLLLGIEGVVIAVFGAPALNFPTFLPVGGVHLPGVSVGTDQLIVVGLTAVAAGGLSLVLRRSRLGVAMQAAVDDPELLALAGTRPERVRALAWVLGFGLAALSGILLGPDIGLDAPLLTLLVVQAFGAAAIGRFRSLPLTYLGGLVVGVGSALSTKYVAHVPALGGLPPSLPFLILFVVLLATPGRLLREGARVAPPSAGAPVPEPVRRVGAPLAVAVAAVVPFLVGPRLPVFTNAAVFVVVFASLGLLVRTSGQVSLCHAAFCAVGAAAFSKLVHGPGVPWLLGLVLAGLVAVPLGALVAVPAIRLSGLYLALATFGFGVLLERLVYDTGLMFGNAGPVSVPRPHVLGLESGRGFYYVALAAALASLALVAAVHRSRLGRLLRGVAGSPRALASLGASVEVTKLLVFCLAAFLAGIAGALFGALAGSIDGSGFGDSASLLWLALVFLSGRRELPSAVVAALLVAVVPDYLGSSSLVTTYEPVVFGAGALLVAASATSRSLGPRAHRLLAAAEERARRSPVAQRLRLEEAG
jgi:branched-subunit amino acid ABC-type transport system permease component